MEQLLDHILNALSISQTDLFNIVFSLLLAVAIAFIISQVYKHTHRGLNFELSFMTTLVALAPIVSIVMFFIRGDLVLSLGLIGSLSIIRFRTPIKDTRDMIFLFWVIAVGLGCGTFNWSIVIVSSMIITVVIFILHFFRYGQTNITDFVLVVLGNGTYRPENIAQLVQKYSSDVHIRSKEIDAESWEVVYEIRFQKLSAVATDGLLNELRLIDGVHKVSLLAPQIALPV